MQQLSTLMRGDAASHGERPDQQRYHSTRPQHNLEPQQHSIAAGAASPFNVEDKRASAERQASAARRQPEG